MLDKDQIITVQGWLPYQSRKVGRSTVMEDDLKLDLNLADFDLHPDNGKLLNHVVDINNHPYLKAVDFKVIVKDYYQVKSWLKGKKVIIIIA